MNISETDQSQFQHLRDELYKLQKMLGKETDYQKGAVAFCNDVLDLIDRILENEN